MPRVSVIIPSYNHEKYVAETIESVLNQTFQDFEIVIVDDASADRTVDIIKGFADERIRLFRFDKNRGGAAAANKCVSEAKGEFVSMLSSDDIFNNDKLEKQVAFLDKNPEIGAVFSYAQIIDEHGNDFTNNNHPYSKIFLQSNRTRFEWLKHFFFYGNCLCHPSVLIRKECYDTIGLYDERFAQLPDFDFWIRLCSRYDIHILPENLIKFRVRNNEANASGDRPQSRIRLLSEMYQILRIYLVPEISDHFSKIFPDFVDELSSFDKDIVPFYLAMLALKVNNPAYNFFAVNIFYQMLASNSATAEKLRDKYSFDYIKIIKIAGQQDVFGIESQLQLEKIKASKLWRLRSRWLKLNKFLGLTEHV